MRIAVFTTSQGTAAPYVINAYIKALTNLGHTVKSFNMDEIALYPKYKEDIYTQVKNFSPDFAISYAVIRGKELFENDKFFLHRLDIAYVCLFYDNPFMYLQQLPKNFLEEFKKRQSTFIFCSDKNYCKEIKEFGFSNVEQLPLATDPERFYPVEDKNLLEGFKNNVSFVGSIFGNPEKLKEKRRIRWERFETLNKKIDEITDKENAGNSLAVVEELNKFKNQLPWDVFAVLCRTVYEEINSLSRMEMVLSLNDEKVSVYGNDPWQNLEDIEYKGPIDYQTQANLLYNATKINLNITSPQLQTAINQRIYDVSAAGGFLLTDYRRDLDRLLNGAVVSYSNFSELKDGCVYYLEHEDERKDIAKKAREIVLNNHTWAHRAQTLIEAVSSKWRIS